MIRLPVHVPGNTPGSWLCTATPDAPSEEDQRWSPACFLVPGHEGAHMAVDPQSGDLLSTITWKEEV